MCAPVILYAELSITLLLSSRYFFLSIKNGISFLIQKFENPSKINNYRPITFTFVIAKSLITLVPVHLRPFLECENFLTDCRHGFHLRRVSGDPLVFISLSWSAALNNCWKNHLVYLSISKAFVRVWHKSLLSNWSSFGFHVTFISWMS